LYSLRHTSITYRIRFDDDDWHTIAANARTSVKCLERFYLSGYKTEQAARKVHGIPKSASVRAETISIDSLGFDVKSSEKPVVDRGSKKGTDRSPHAVYEKNWDYNDHSDGSSIGRTGASGIERLSWYQRQQPKMVYAAASSERMQ
jgi:hypothetical protein